MKKVILSTGNSKTRDPFVVKHNNKYYHCFSDDGKTISMAEFDYIEEMNSAKSKVVFVPDKEEYSKELWAPELHIIDNKCYIYVACDDGNNFNHRMYVLENNSSNPMDEFYMHGKITDSTDKWAIDGNLIKYKGQLYYFWSGWEGDKNIRQNIYVSKMKDPFTLESERVLISTPEYDWEKIGCTNGLPYINEGPFAFLNNDELYLAYSASGSWGKGYCIAFLKFVGENLLDPKAWYKFNKPTLSKNDVLFGAGHCCIINDNEKKLVFFHAWDKDVKDIYWHNVSTWQAELEIINGEIVLK